MPKSEVFCPDIIKMKNDKGIYTESPELPKSEQLTREEIENKVIEESIEETMGSKNE